LLILPFRFGRIRRAALAAERALRHLAVQRKISGAFSEKGARDYLRLLAIAQSCRFQRKSFLGFLLSKSKNVDEYQDRSRMHPYWGIAPWEKEWTHASKLPWLVGRPRLQPRGAPNQVTYSKEMWAGFERRFAADVDA